MSELPRLSGPPTRRARCPTCDGRRYVIVVTSRACSTRRGLGEVFELVAPRHGIDLRPVASS